MCSAVRLDWFITLLCQADPDSIINKTRVSSQGYRASENPLGGRKLRIIKDFVGDEETFARTKSLMLIDSIQSSQSGVGMGSICPAARVLWCADFLGALPRSESLMKLVIEGVSK